MTNKERVVALELELHETRRTAVEMMLGMLDVVTRTPAEREAVARGFDRAAAVVDPKSAHFARLMAAAIRRRLGGSQGGVTEVVDALPSLAENDD